MSGKKQYWVTRSDNDYDIFTSKPEMMGWPHIEGPFATLAAAKKRARYWISTDRRRLKNCLDDLNALKVSDFKG